MEEMHSQEVQKRKQMELRQEEERRRREEEMARRQEGFKAGFPENVSPERRYINADQLPFYFDYVTGSFTETLQAMHLIEYEVSK